MKFTKLFLTDTLDLPGEAIEETIISQARWSTQFQIIFKHNDRYYMTKYSQGSTESQDCGPWEDLKNTDEIDCNEVELKEVLTKQWVVKKDSI
jgi:hypothetical protein